MNECTLREFKRNFFFAGTAAVVLAGLLACCKVMHKKLHENSFIFLGAGGVKND